MIYEENRFAHILKDLEPDLRSFVSSETRGTSDSVIDNVLYDTRVVFDDVNKPYDRDTMNDFLKLVEKLKNKYSGKGGYASEQMMELLNRLSKLGEQNGEKMFSAEGVYSPLFDNQILENDEETANDIAALRKAIRNAHHGGTVKGLYDHSDKTITFFTRNMDGTEEDYISVFCHEFFHAVHMTLLDEKGCLEILNQYYHEVVLESLATYFQIYFLVHKELWKRADTVRDDSYRFSPVFWPYSGCKEIRDSSHFADVLHLSMGDFEGALRRFVTTAEADLIMQKKTFKPIIRKPSIAGTSPVSSTGETTGTAGIATSSSLDGISGVSMVNGVPLILFPADSSKFKKEYELCGTYYILVCYRDDTCEVIPVLFEGKPLKSDIIVHIRTNNKLKVKNFSTIRLILAVTKDRYDKIKGSF